MASQTLPHVVSYSQSKARKSRTKPKNHATAKPEAVFSPEPRPKRTRRRRLTERELLERIDDGTEKQSIRDLVRVGRGAAMILDSLWEGFKSAENDRIANIATGLAEALFIACDEADFNYFQSPGEIAKTLEPRKLQAVLNQEIRRTRKGERHG